LHIQFCGSALRRWPSTPRPPRLRQRRRRLRHRPPGHHDRRL